MKHSSAALVLLLATSLCNGKELPACFLGVWRSDETRTLEDMHKHPEVTERARALFEKNFFGRLVVINGPSYSGAYLDGDQTRSDIKFDRINIIESSENSVVFSFGNESLESHNEFFCENGYLYTYVTKWKFKEYFMPIQ